MEEEEVIAHLVDVAAVALDALINFFKEEVFNAVNLHEHLPTFILLANAELVIDCLYVKRLLKHAQVGECS